MSLMIEIKPKATAVAPSPPCSISAVSRLNHRLARNSTIGSVKNAHAGRKMIVMTKTIPTPMAQACR